MSFETQNLRTVHNIAKADSSNEFFLRNSPPSQTILCDKILEGGRDKKTRCDLRRVESAKSRERTPDSPPLP